MGLRKTALLLPLLPGPLLLMMLGGGGAAPMVEEEEKGLCDLRGRERWPLPHRTLSAGIAAARARPDEGRSAVTGRVEKRTELTWRGEGAAAEGGGSVRWMLSLRSRSFCSVVRWWR